MVPEIVITTPVQTLPPLEMETRNTIIRRELETILSSTLDTNLSLEYSIPHESETLLDDDLVKEAIQAAAAAITNMDNDNDDDFFLYEDLMSNAFKDAAGEILGGNGFEMTTNSNIAFTEPTDILYFTEDEINWAKIVLPSYGDENPAQPNLIQQKLGNETENKVINGINAVGCPLFANQEEKHKSCGANEEKDNSHIVDADNKWNKFLV